MAREYILSSFGLQALKPIVYGDNLGESIKTGGASFEVQPYESPRSMAIEADDKPQMSYLGTPIFSDLMISENDSTGLYMSTVLFDVSHEKNIIKTSIVGRSGTIKEYIADGDYVITIRGAFVSEGNNYPLDEVTEFVRLMKLPQALNVTSKLLQLYEIDDIVIESYSLPQQEGMQNTQLFEINAVSDLPLLFLDNDQINQ